MGFNKILIIKIGALGDLLMTTPAIRALKKAFPSSAISLLVGISSMPAVRGNPHIDELIECDDYKIYKGSLPGKLKYLAGLAAQIRKKHFDIVFVLHRDWRFNLLAFLCGIRRRVGFDRDGEGMFLTDRIKISGVRHQVYQYLDVVKSIGVNDDGVRMNFAVGVNAQMAAAELLSKAGLPSNVSAGGAHGNKPLIGILPGGAKNVKMETAIKRWPLECYVELAKRLAVSSYSVILLGADSDKPSAQVVENEAGVVNLTGKTTLEETAAIMKMCGAIITHDSGPMHLAAAAGTPVISIFGPTDPEEYHPLDNSGYYFRHIEGLECAPCYKDGIFPDCKTLNCMRAVTVDMVYQKVKDVIDARR